jgi:hypothetical protein
LRIDCTKIALGPGTEPQLVLLGKILEACVHPVDANPRLLKILLTTQLIELRYNSLAGWFVFVRFDRVVACSSDCGDVIGNRADRAVAMRRQPISSSLK